MKNTLIITFVFMMVIVLSGFSANAFAEEYVLGDWETCAIEGEICSFVGEKEVRYGKNQTWYYDRFTDDVLCTSGVFEGNPLENIVKECQYRGLATLTLTFDKTETPLDMPVIVTCDFSGETIDKMNLWSLVRDVVQNNGNSYSLWSWVMDLTNHQPVEFTIDKLGTTTYRCQVKLDDFDSSESSRVSLTTIEAPPEKKSSSGCSDCAYPTNGKDKYGTVKVEKGFGIDGNIVDVTGYHTEFPLITLNVGQEYLFQTTIYENRGLKNMRTVQFAFGVSEVGSPMNNAEALAVLHFEMGMNIEKIEYKDTDNLIDKDTVRVTTEPVKCKENSNNESCILVKLYITFREAPINQIVAVNMYDFGRNSHTSYFDDGIELVGESLNESSTDKIFVKTSSQIKGIWLELVRTDKVNNIWTGNNGIEYSKNSYGNYNKLSLES